MRRLFITRSTLILAFAIWFVEISFSSEPLTPVPKVSVNRVELKRSPHGSYITATCTFENPTSNEVKYTGYARNSFAPPLKPGSISPIYSVEYKSDGQWHECPIGWCGTGMVRLGAKPGTTGVFDVILPASAWDWEAIRIGLRCSSSNSKEGTSTMVWSESVSHDGIVHLWRLKRIPDNSSATPGLIGRTTVGDKDIGLAVKYAMGKPLLNATIQEEVFRCGGELKNARITLTGVLHVPQATTVLAWHAGGSASRRLMEGRGRGVPTGMLTPLPRRGWSWARYSGTGRLISTTTLPSSARPSALTPPTVRRRVTGCGPTALRWGVFRPTGTARTVLQSAQFQVAVTASRAMLTATPTKMSTYPI